MVRANGKVAAISGEQGRCRPLSQNRLASLDREGVGWRLHDCAIAERHRKIIVTMAVDHVKSTLNREYLLASRHSRHARPDHF